MRRDGALVERFAGGALVGGQVFLVGHLRRASRAGQVGLALLHLCRSALALLALNFFGPRSAVAGLVGLVDHIVVPAAGLAAAVCVILALAALAALLAALLAATLRRAAAAALALLALRVAPKRRPSPARPA